jgi:ribonuclease D
MTNRLYCGDLPEGLDFGPIVAVDTEAMGLNPHRDRLCLVQLSAGDGDAHLVQFAPGAYAAPRLRELLADRGVIKLFHFARFDLGMIYHYLGVMATPLYCTKIASRLARTFTDRHGLRDLCKDLLNIDLSKQQQSSDWGAETLTEEQVRYAASDVLHLHALRGCRIAFCLISEAGRSKTSSRINCARRGRGVSILQTERVIRTP